MDDYRAPNNLQYLKSIYVPITAFSGLAREVVQRNRGKQHELSSCTELRCRALSLPAAFHRLIKIADRVEMEKLVG